MERISTETIESIAKRNREKAALRRKHEGIAVVRKLLKEAAIGVKPAAENLN